MRKVYLYSSRRKSLSKKEILIVGAGPSGLALAIFLSEKGYKPRIIDKKAVISEYSKALGVNARTLSILEEFNITQRFLQNGRIMPAVSVWKNNKLVFRNEFATSKQKYPFVLVQPQKESEEILLEELSNRKIQVEYSTELETFEENENDYIATINSKIKEQHHSDYIIGADGSHSVVRKKLNIEFEGFRYNETWELYDVELEIDLPKDDANILLHKKGGMILIRIKNNIWRVAGSLTDLLNYLPKNTKIGNINWSSKFNISHNVAKSLVANNAVLIGDAAHIHSPIGGRGMNLGIEDAYIVSRLIKEDRLNEYEKIRKSYLRKTVSKVNNMTQIMAGTSFASKIMRSNLHFAKPFIPIVKPTLRDFALGLDNM